MQYVPASACARMLTCSSSAWYRSCSSCGDGGCTTPGRRELLHMRTCHTPQLASGSGACAGAIPPARRTSGRVPPALAAAPHQAAAVQPRTRNTSGTPSLHRQRHNCRRPTCCGRRWTPKAAAKPQPHGAAMRGVASRYHGRCRHSKCRLLGALPLLRRIPPALALPAHRFLDGCDESVLLPRTCCFELHAQTAKGPLMPS